MKIEVEVDLDEAADEIKTCMDSQSQDGLCDMVDAMVEHIKKLESEAESKDAKIAELMYKLDGG